MMHGQKNIKVVRGVFELDMSFSCWFRGIKVHFRV